jgi:cytochrome c-type biogenesis protein CcmH
MALAKTIRSAAVTLLLFAGVAAVSLPAGAQQTDRAKNLSMRMMCVCGCNQVLGVCNHVGCTYSHGMLQEIDERVARNESDDLTIQAFVQEYGASVMLLPAARGFNLWVWIMPVILPLVGLVLARALVLRWRKRAILAPAGGVSPDLLERARREADEGEI